MYEERDGIKMTDDQGPQTGPVVVFGLLTSLARRFHYLIGVDPQASLKEHHNITEGDLR